MIIKIYIISQKDIIPQILMRLSLPKERCLISCGINLHKHGVDPSIDISCLRSIIFIFSTQKIVFYLSNVGLVLLFHCFSLIPPWILAGWTYTHMPMHIQVWNFLCRKKGWECWQWWGWAMQQMVSKLSIQTHKNRRKIQQQWGQWNWKRIQHLKTKKILHTSFPSCLRSQV